ncbi:protein-L-isoaspartate O-methyltransferase [Sphingomonas sp. G124]|uniref:Protein-L-isoaspartate O-methyltransferase n=1 Tax=Sphingomonas cremea TaxID=2904799 RepID=A0A9X1QLW4_9SPHN|nr:methyltransferase domain-containing protein [Sphingomonas cremea]MCF2515510.1 protein-L-isoaspartate O-methyltransferase [Sphingomonas cremea]
MRDYLKGSPGPLMSYLLLLLGLAACRAEPQPSAFPPAGRDIAPIVGDSFSTEDTRDRVGEAEEVMRLAGVVPAMSIADVGAGEGYYTVRLSPIVGPRGRVLAQDIVPETRDRLAQRVQRENLDNVAVRLGQPANPLLPAHSFDRIFLVHMYHEVTEPYEFLWHLRDGLKDGGLVIVVDADRPVKRHGMTPKQLICEFAAVGLSPVRTSRLAGSDAYFIAFKVSAPRPEPAQIKPCGKA